MSIFVYNNIILSDIKSVVYKKVPVKTGPNYLYTRHTLHIKAMYNPVAVSYALQQTPNFINLGGGGFAQAQTPVALQGQLGAVTDQAIRDALMQPRRSLTFDQGATLTDAVNVIASPLKTTSHPDTDPQPDASNGPWPLFCDVKPRGNKSFEVDFVIQTDLNEQYLYASAPVILSHEWSMHHSVDQDYMTNRTIRGRVVFDAGALSIVNDGPLGFGNFVDTVLPDDFRASFFFPVPKHFKRDHVDVWALEDGVTLEYVIIDIEQPFVVIADQSNNPTRIESYHTATVSRGSIAEGTHGLKRTLAVAAVTGAGKLINKAYEGLTGLFGYEPTVEVDTGAINKGLEFVSALAFPPRVSHEIVARVWGNRLANRGQLLAVANRILIDRIDAVFKGGLAANLKILAGFNNSVTYDNLDKFCELHAIFQTGPLLSLASGLINHRNSTIPMMPQVDTIANVTADDGQGPLPPGDGISRGTYLADAIATILNGPHTVGVGTAGLGMEEPKKATPKRDSA